MICKIDVDHYLIRDLEMTAANLHDGDVNLAEEGDQAVYRDKGYFGKQPSAQRVSSPFWFTVAFRYTSSNGSTVNF